MSLYNMMHGVNPAAFYILPVLGKHPDEYGRFRDCFIGDPERTDTEGKIIVYTRLGGGNREAYEDDIEDIRAMPGFLFDYDDDFDCTYANFVFDIPEQWSADVAKVLAGDLASVSDGYVELVAGIYPKVEDKLRAAMRPASAMSARSDETQSGSVRQDASATAEGGDAQPGAQP